jgi:hypothetical protein
MKMNLIPINECTLDMIQALNGGVRPDLEANHENWFAYKGEEEHADIITQEEAEAISEWWTTIKICYLDI